MSLKRNVNHDTMRKENILLVLNCIIENGPISKKEVREKTGLGWATVSVIANELADKKLIVERKKNDGHIGRNPIVLDINQDMNYILGLDINISGITATLIDLKCRIVYSKRREEIRKDKESVLKAVFDVIDSIFGLYNTREKNILGIGISMQGAVDSIEGISIYNPYFLNWSDVPLKKLFEEKYKMPVFVDRSPNCMALSERWLGSAKGVMNMLFIRHTLSMGIGMSITINGEIYHGGNSNAGEFGHMTMKPDGILCSCGNYGCLETVASYSSIVKKIIDGIKSGQKTVITRLLDGKPLESIDIGLINRAYDLGDDFCIKIINEMATYLGIAVSNAINLFNPDMVIIGGEMTRYESMYMPKLKEVVEKRTWEYSSKKVVVSGVADYAAPIGAAIIIIQKICNGQMDWSSPTR